MKDRFENWSQQKQILHKKGKAPYFREGEIRWVIIGQNIGSEIYGKGEQFSRPVLILKKVYNHSALIIPLTSKVKHGSYYCIFSDSKGKEFSACLTQIRYVDGNRVTDKISSIDLTTRNHIDDCLVSLIKKTPHA